MTSDCVGAFELEGQLDQLLSESVGGALERERTMFDRLTAPYTDSLVLFGAGNLGRKTLAGLRRLGIEPLAFTDSNRALWGQSVGGLEVLPPEVAALKYATQAAFVITIWTHTYGDRTPDRVRQLRQLGCRTVVTFGPLFWKYPEVFLPHYSVDVPHKVHEQADDVRRALGLWADDASRREYLTQVRWRLLFDFEALSDPVSHPMYFPHDLCSLTDDEEFVDGGAFDGDTIRSFVVESNSSFKKLVAFEPDPTNYAKLRETVSGMPEKIRKCILLNQAALGEHNRRVRFLATGSVDAAVGNGDLEVDCVALDGLADFRPTYIKLDIEGSEVSALAGARRSIERYSPVLAVCSYHAQDHLWRVPLLINSFNAGYRFFLRPHLPEVWDLVCYAVPDGRLARHT
jgi:FkbM family methyltransferase